MEVMETEVGGAIAVNPGEWSGIASPSVVQFTPSKIKFDTPSLRCIVLSIFRATGKFVRVPTWETIVQVPDPGAPVSWNSCVDVAQKKKKVIEPEVDFHLKRRSEERRVG